MTLSKPQCWLIRDISERVIRQRCKNKEKKQNNWTLCGCAIQTKPQLCLPHPCTKTMLRFWKVYSYFHFHSSKAGQEAGCAEIPQRAAWTGEVSSKFLQGSGWLLLVNRFGGGAVPVSQNLPPASPSWVKIESLLRLRVGLAYGCKEGKIKSSFLN